MAGGQMKAVYSTPWSKRRPKPKTYKGKIKKAVKQVKDKDFKKKVLSIVKKEVETKQAFSSIQDLAFNSAINSAADVQWMLPQIAQGTADNARIGDQIRAQKLTIQGFMNTRFSYGSNTYYQACRLAVRMMVVQPKQYSGITAIQANATSWMAGLLKKGGTTTGFTGLQSDIYAPINTDLITCYYNKVFFINQPYSNVLTGSGQSNLLMPVNTVKHFKINLKLRNKLLRYDAAEQSGLSPVNYNPVLILGYCLVDGSADVVNTAIALSLDTIFDYEDA